MIAGWLAASAGRVLVTATYDSAHRLDEALRLAGRKAQLVVCDEAHRTGRKAGKMTAAVLREGFLPGPRLYMTATQGRDRRAGRRRAGGRVDGRRERLRPVFYRYRSPRGSATAG